MEKSRYKEMQRKMQRLVEETKQKAYDELYFRAGTEEGQRGSVSPVKAEGLWEYLLQVRQIMDRD